MLGYWCISYVHMRYCDDVTLDVSGIIEKINVYATLAIVPRTKEINKALWLVYIFIKTLNFKLLGRRISLLHDFSQKNLALLLVHNYSGNVYSHVGQRLHIGQNFPKVWSTYCPPSYAQFPTGRPVLSQTNQWIHHCSTLGGKDGDPVLWHTTVPL